MGGFHESIGIVVFASLHGRNDAGFFMAGQSFQTFSQYSTQFMDFMGLGSTVSLGLAVFAEVVCAAMIVVGLFTRFATVPLMITMFVAAFVVHAQDPFHKQEFALMYFAGYFAIFLSGSGTFFSTVHTWSHQY